VGTRSVVVGTRLLAACSQDEPALAADVAMADSARDGCHRAAGCSCMPPDVDSRMVARSLASSGICQTGSRLHCEYITGKTNIFQWLSPRHPA
jgi:hypothetical protein